MSEPVLEDEKPGWGIAGIQMESDNQYSSDENIENNLGVEFNMHTPDFKKHFDAGLGTVWTPSHNQPDFFQNLPKFRLKQTNRVMDSQNTGIEQIDIETLSRARRLSPQSDSTSEGLAQRPQRNDELDDILPLNFAKRMTPRIENVVPLPEIPGHNQQKVMYVS